jgi:hypothetical protein
MRFGFALPLLLGTLSVSLATFEACSTSSSNGGDGGADATEEPFTVCNIGLFLDAGGSGAPCPQASPTRCFPECTRGGCYCQGATPTWTCTIDHSCEPDAPPGINDGSTPDAGPEPGPEAGPEAAPDATGEAGPEAGVEAGPDAAPDASDGGADGATE